MKTIGTDTIKIEDISNLSEVTDRLKEPRIRERARSIKETGQLNEPVVRRSDMKLLAGRDRVAAHLLLKRKTAMVKLVECTDEEAEKIELVENVERRHNSEEAARQQTRLLSLYAQEAAELQALPDAPKAKNGVGRPRGALSPQGEARRKLAKAKGVNPDSVRRQEARKKLREVRGVVKAANNGKLPESGPTVKLLGVDREFGLEFDPAFFAGIAALQNYLREAMSRTRAAGQALNQVKNSEIAFPSALLQRLIEENHDLYQHLKSAQPSSICPSCKCLAGVQEECAGCATLGWITAGQEAGVPPELWVEDRASAVVQFRGGTKLVADVIGNAEVAEPVVELEDAPAEDDAADPFGDL